MNYGVDTKLGLEQDSTTGVDNGYDNLKLRVS